MFTKVVCCDGVEFEVDEDAVMVSGTLKQMTEDIFADDHIRIHSKVFEKVLDFCRSRAGTIRKRAAAHVVAAAAVKAATTAGDTASASGVIEIVPASELKPAAAGDTAAASVTKIVPTAELKAASTGYFAVVEETRKELMDFDSVFFEMDHGTLLDLCEAGELLRIDELRDCCYEKLMIEQASWDRIIKLHYGREFLVEEAVAMELPQIRYLINIGVKDIPIPGTPLLRTFPLVLDYCRVRAKMRRRLDRSGKLVAPDASAKDQLLAFKTRLFSLDLNSILFLFAEAKALDMDELLMISAEAAKKPDRKMWMSLTLRSSDGKEVVVEEYFACQSRIIQRMVDNGEAKHVIQLSNVPYAILDMIIELCKKYVHEGSGFQYKLPDMDDATLFDLISAASYLDIPWLVDMGRESFMATRVPNHFKFSTPLQIKKRKVLDGLVELKPQADCILKQGMNVTVCSADGQEFSVEAEVAMQSGTIRKRLVDDCSAQRIMLPNIHSSILHVIIQLCRKQVNARDQRTPEDEIAIYEMEFLKQNKSKLPDLALAASYLDIKWLEELTVDVIRGIIDHVTSPESIQQEELPKEPWVDPLSQMIADVDMAGLERYEAPAELPSGQGVHAIDINGSNTLLANLYDSVLLVKHGMQAAIISYPLNPTKSDRTLRDGMKLHGLLLDSIQQIREKIVGWGGEPLPIPPLVDEPLPYYPGVSDCELPS